MSTGPRTQAAFFRGNQSKVEHDASHSALCYLFQEVSKLASPYQNGFPDTHPPSKRLNDTSRNNAVEGKKDSHSFQTATTSYQHSLSCMLPYDQVRKVKEESHGSEVTTLVEPPYECNSPWKVLSLINLHCERLLHRRDKEEMDPSSASSTTKTGNSTAKWSTAEPDLTLRPPLLFCGRKEITASVGPTDDVMGNGTRDGFKLRCCVKDSEVGCRVQFQTAVKTDIIGPELLEDNAKASLQPQHRYKMDVKLSVNRQLEWGQELKKACSSTQQDILDVCFSGNALSQTHTPKACPNTQLTFNSNNKAYSALSKPALTLDHNANLTLPTETLCDTPLPAVSSALPSSQSASLIFSTSENGHSLSKQDDKITASKPECAHAPTEENSPPVSQLKPSGCNVSSTTPKSEFWTVQKAEIGLPSSHQWKTKTPRKQPHPCRSADIQDPDFQGVTFRMDTELDDSRKQCRLLITSKYSNELCKSVRKPRLRTRTSQKSHKTSSSEEENDLTANALKDKVCASCCTKKTPMWRDAEDGTPLCNACGIRYKKYRVRCVNCWHIPRKEGNSISCCLKCGNFVRLTSAQRKRTS